MSALMPSAACLSCPALLLTRRTRLETRAASAQSGTHTQTRTHTHTHLRCALSRHTMYLARIRTSSHCMCCAIRRASLGMAFDAPDVHIQDARRTHRTACSFARGWRTVLRERNQKARSTATPPTHGPQLIGRSAKPPHAAFVRRNDAAGRDRELSCSTKRPLMHRNDERLLWKTLRFSQTPQQCTTMRARRAVTGRRRTCLKSGSSAKKRAPSAGRPLRMLESSVVQSSPSSFEQYLPKKSSRRIPAGAARRGAALVAVRISDRRRVTALHGAAQ